MDDTALRLRAPAMPPARSGEGLEEVRAFLAEKGWQFEPRPAIQAAGPRAGTRYRAAHLPSGAYLCYIRYGVEARLRAPPERGDHAVFLPAHGRFEAVIGTEAVQAHPGMAVVAPPMGRQVNHAAADSGRLILHVPDAVLTRHLAALLGDRPREPLSFAAAMRLDMGPGRSFASLLRFVIDEIGRHGSLLSHPLPAAQLEQTLLTALLLAQPSNYSDRLAAWAGRPVALGSLRRARDHIEAHLDEPLTLDGIAAAAGMPGRTLQAQFRRFQGCSPMAYLRAARFRRAREALSQPGETASVTELAMRCGFAHLGRFAVEYRRRFGESPSETAARARREAGPLLGRQPEGEGRYRGRG